MLIENKPVAEPVAERWVGYLRQAFPGGRIDLADIPSDVDLSTLTGDPRTRTSARLPWRPECNG